MNPAMSTPATSASASNKPYCEPCERPFAGKKEFDWHMKTAKAHNPSGITCYYPFCSKTYQKWESLHTHVGRDHRDEIGRFKVLDSKTGLTFPDRGSCLGKLGQEGDLGFSATW
jgi:hypothetical protein